MIIIEIDLIPLFGTFISCLFVGVEIGILIGIAIDVAILLYYNSRPKLLIEQISVSYFKYKINYVIF